MSARQAAGAVVRAAASAVGGAAGAPREYAGLLGGAASALLARGRHFVRRTRTQLTGKTGPKGYYKGKGVKSVGSTTKKGGFRVNPKKLPDYVVPDLEGFALKPYVQRGPAPEGALRPWAAGGAK